MTLEEQIKFIEVEMESDLHFEDIKNYNTHSEILVSLESYKALLTNKNLENE